MTSLLENARRLSKGFDDSHIGIFPATFRTRCSIAESPIDLKILFVLDPFSSLSDGRGSIG